MIKRTIVERVEEYDKKGVLVRATTTETSEEDTSCTQYGNLFLPVSEWPKVPEPTDGVAEPKPETESPSTCDKDEAADAIAADEPEGDIMVETEIELTDEALHELVEMIADTIIQRLAR